MRSNPHPNLLPRAREGAVIAMVTALLASCAGGPALPDWQVNTKSAIDAAVAAYLRGGSKAESPAFDRARSEIARTGRPELVARVELMRCAARVASLVFEPCEGFEKLRADAQAPERAYADYLAGKALSREEAEHLPPAQRGAAVQAIEDPLSRLIAIAVAFQAGKASPEMIALAADTASAQGWRRPLLAWLGVQAMRAQRTGQVNEAQRLQRRIELVQGAQ